MNVHTGDPITSYEAAAAIEPVRHAHKAKVLAALAQHPGAIAVRPRRRSCDCHPRN